MSFVATNDFLLEPYNLPSEVLEGNSFADFADREIRKELEKILGSTLYTAFIAAYDASQEDDSNDETDPIALETRWQKLIDGDSYTSSDNKTYKWKGFKAAFVPYVYAIHTKLHINTHTSTGVTESKVENGVLVSAGRRVVTGQNEYCDLVGHGFVSFKDTLAGYLYNSGDTFDDVVTDEYSNIKSYMLDRCKFPKKMNVFNL